MYQQIIYLSRATSQRFDRDLPAILRTARRNNEAASVTGLLTLAGDTFVQLLEGAPHRVSPLLEQICRDARHTEIEVLLDRLVAKRSCEDWTMAFGTIESYPGGREAFVARLRQLAGEGTAAAQSVCVALIAQLDHAELA